MKKILSVLESKKFLYAIIAFWFILQVGYLIAYWGVPQSSDGSYYLKLAQECVDANTWYPDVHNIEDSYLFAPAFINLLILTHKIFGAFHYVVLFNLLFNIGLLASTYLLAKKVFSQKVANFSVLLFCLTFSNFTSPIAILGDLPYTFLVMASLVFATRDKLLPVLIAGIIIALSNWLRPLSVIFIFTTLVYMLFNRYVLSKYIAYIAAILAVTVAIGLSTKGRIGEFMYASNTSGINLAGAANKYATGSVSFGFEKDEFYADLMAKEYEQKLFQNDTDLKNRAISWIKENPYDYLKLFPKKLVLLYSLDNWTERSEKGKGFADLLNKEGTSSVTKIKVIALAALKSAVYYLVMLLFLVYLWQNKRNILSKENIFLLVPFLGTGITIIFMVTDRYHYAFMPIITIYAACALAKLFEKKQMSS